MSEKGTLTNERAADYIENEGVGYAVQHYISAEYFKDQKTVELWDAANKALTALTTYLSEETGRDVQ